MRRLIVHYTGPSLADWLRQRCFQIYLLTTLLMLDVAVTYLFVEVYGTSCEKNLLMAPVLELPFGYALAALLKLLVVLLVMAVSWHTYRSLHSDGNYRKTKWHMHKLEVWLWLGMIVMAAAVDIVLLANAVMSL